MMTHRRRLLVTGAALILLLGGCAPAASPPQTGNPADQSAARLYNTYGRALEAGASVYTESLLAAGEAHARGAITDGQLESVRSVGRRAETALRLAKVALQLYLARSAAQRSGGADVALTSDLSARFAEFNRVLTELTETLVRAGVTR